MQRWLILALGMSSASLAYAFEASSWPYEGIPFFRVITDRLLLHKEPSSQSARMGLVSIQNGSIASFPNGVKELLRKLDKYGKVYGVEAKTSINTNIILDKSIQRTVAPGMLRAIADGTFAGWRYEKAESKEEVFSFDKGDVIQELLYVGEGVCVIKFRDSILYQHGCFYQETEVDRTLVRLSEPVTEWWVSFQKDGRTIGWLKLKNENRQLELIETIK